jgi:triose/dihydroxyacetone kinase / FAD-AMP lyase (cyclizing)
LSRTGNVEKAAEAAEGGARKTISMKPSLGRTVYVGGKGWQEVPDPGAYGLSEFLLGLAQALR